jgi:hypothetical protein
MADGHALQSFRMARADKPRACRTFRNRQSIEGCLREWFHVAYLRSAVPQGNSGHCDVWDQQWPTPPKTAAEALDPHGRWGALKCGAEVCRCEEHGKGMGAFATRPIASGALVGLYWGELLTRRMAHARHGWKFGVDVEEESPLEEAQSEARHRRLAALAALPHGAPIGGSSNGGSYFFELGEPGSAWRRRQRRRRPGSVSEGTVSEEEVTEADAELVHAVGIDGEDASRSSWCRYINNAPPSRSNLSARVNRSRCLIWFEAKREITTGEELTFTYSDEPLWLYTWKRAGGFSLVWILVVISTLLSGALVDLTTDYASLRGMRTSLTALLLVSAAPCVGHVIASWTASSYTWAP